MKNIAGLECKVEDKIYRLTCDSDAPLIQIKEALFQFLKYIGQIEDAHRLAQERAIAESSENKVQELPKE